MRAVFPPLALDTAQVRLGCQICLFHQRTPWVSRWNQIQLGTKRKILQRTSKEATLHGACSQRVRKQAQCGNTSQLRPSCPGSQPQCPCSERRSQPWSSTWQRHASRKASPDSSLSDSKKPPPDSLTTKETRSRLGTAPQAQAAVQTQKRISTGATSASQPMIRQTNWQMWTATWVSACHQIPSSTRSKERWASQYSRTCSRTRRSRA